MDNFDLRKYLAEGKLLKENKYDIDDPNSPLGQLNDNDQDVAILNNMIKKYGKDVVLMWMSSGEYGDREYFEEGKLLKEVMDEEMVDYVSAMYDSDVDQEAEEGFQSDVWSKAQYASNAYNESSIFLELIDHLKSVGGKDVVEGNPDIELELLPNGDIRWSANVTHY